MLESDFGGVYYAIIIKLYWYSNYIDPYIKQPDPVPFVPRTLVSRSTQLVVEGSAGVLRLRQKMPWVRYFGCILGGAGDLVSRL